MDWYFLRIYQFEADWASSSTWALPGQRLCPNMRVVRKKVSSKDANPTFSPGWSYFVENTKYKEHLAQYKDQKETVSCCFII